VRLAPRMNRLIATTLIAGGFVFASVGAAAAQDIVVDIPYRLIDAGPPGVEFLLAEESVAPDHQGLVCLGDLVVPNNESVDPGNSIRVRTATPKCSWSTSAMGHSISTGAATMRVRSPVGPLGSERSRRTTEIGMTGLRQYPRTPVRLSPGNGTGRNDHKRSARLRANPRDLTSLTLKWCYVTPECSSS
jgi:hypothetical protein